MLTVNAATIRLFLHILGATVWVGGQIVLAGLVPVVRKDAGVDTLRAVARRFQWLAWPAYVLLLVTGVWNLTAEHAGDQSSAYLTTLFVKLLLVGLSGAAAAGHIIVRKPAAKGLLASLALLTALGAAFLGVLLGTGG
jgi:putative copper export protein